MPLTLATQILRSSKRRMVLGLAGLVAAAALSLTWWMVPAKRTFHVDEEGKQATLTARVKRVADALAHAKVKVGPHDQVAPSLSSPLEPDMHIRIRHAITLTVQADGKEQQVTLVADRVSDAFDRLGIKVGTDDRVEPALSEPVSDGLKIAVTRIRHEVVAQETEVPFDEERQEDRSMIVGEVHEIQAGQPGKKETQLRQTFENDKLVKTEPVGERIVAAPIARILAFGTMGVVSRGGFQYRYTREYTMRATAYAIGDGMTPGTHTAIGLPARYGVVAVDPRVIPLGTRLYIEGYGPALAADTGGAIKGMRIDLCYDSVDEVESFGYQTVKVYVLPD